MKKLQILILTLIMALGICTSAFASAVPTPLGETDAKVHELKAKGYTDYVSQYGVVGLLATEKPSSGFDIQVGTNPKVSLPFPNIITSTTQSASMSGKQSVKIIDECVQTNFNRVLTRYDFQYRIVPEGADRQSQPIVADFITDWNGVQAQLDTAISNMEKLNKNCNLELYLCVADGSASSDTDYNWSANGNVVVGKTDSHFPNGVIWYFSGMVIQYSVGAPDFWPTVPSLSYTGKVGSTITIPAQVVNSGKEDTTDFAASWAGGGWTSPYYKADNLTIDKDQRVDTPVTVTIPETTKTLWLKANVDGKTPTSEVNQKNNAISVTVGPEGVDLAVSMSAAKTTYTVNSGYDVSPTVDLHIVRKDAGTEPVNAVVSWTGPNGPGSQEIVATPGYNDVVYISFSTGKAGTYTFTGQAWPSGQTELTPENNTTSFKLTVVVKAAPSNGPSDAQIKVNLNG